MKVAVHLHLYYLEQLPELLARLENLNNGIVRFKFAA